MNTSYRLAYCQARIQARLALLPTDDDWQRLNGARGLSAFLEEARSGPLRAWVQGFSRHSDTHEIEHGLRVAYRETVQQLTRWMPDRWRPAMDWTGWLADLALLDHLMRDGLLPGSADADPRWRTLSGPDGILDRQALADAGASCLLTGEPGPMQAWLVEWRRRWPSCSRQARRNLDALVALIGTHHQQLTGAASNQVWGLRQVLRARLKLLLHQRPLQPAAPFIYLGLVVLDLERLRAALVERALFVLDEAA